MRHALDQLLPRPSEVVPAEGVVTFAPDAAIAAPDAPDLAAELAHELRSLTGFAWPMRDGPAAISFTLKGDSSLGNEGYELVIDHALEVVAHRPAGLAMALASLRQLLPPRGPVALPRGRVRDVPRFAYRGLMLDVARHFFPRAEVERLIDLGARFKLNHLHLHLSDDQGFRIAIDGWPALTELGARSAVDGDPGGFFTQDDYRALVAYAAARHVVIVPEIDMPGHTGAALASCPALNRDGIAPPPYTGTAVGHTSLAVELPETERFVRDVLTQLAALTPGPFLHVGGDEAQATPHDGYVRFIERVQALVVGLGKRMVGWEEIAAARLAPGTVAQHWWSGKAQAAVAQGAQVIMSPARHAYLDMKYDEHTRLGLAWAGTIDERKAYEWDPAALVEGVGEAAILGVEAPLWTETVRTRADLDAMLFPRLLAVAEVGWTAAPRRRFDDFAARVGALGPRLTALGVAPHVSPMIPWI